MRYYGLSYKDSIRKAVSDVSNSIDGYKYTDRISNINIDEDQHFLKDTCLFAAGKAEKQIDSVKNKSRDFIKVVFPYYEGVEKTASTVMYTAKKIGEMLNEANSAMLRIDNALNETKEYKGKKVTSGAIKNAGVDKKKCASLSAEIWKKIVELQVNNDIISDFVAVKYVNIFNEKLKNHTKLSTDDEKIFDDIYSHYISIFQGLQYVFSPIELEIFNNLYDHYVELRFGPNGNARKLPEKTIQNCIDVYEFLNPKAKQITDTFFQKIYDGGNEDEIFTSRIIKYVLYTDEPKYRDVILYYLPGAELGVLPPGGISNKSGKTINLVLTEDKDHSLENDGAFTHEMGHFIDDFAFEDINGENGEDIDDYSDQFGEQLRKDLRSHIVGKLIYIGYYDMSKEDRDAVVDFILSPENVNVSTVTDSNLYKKYLPDDWSPRQIKAFESLRNYYGYTEYIYDPSNPDVYDTKGHHGLADGTPEKGIIDDVSGGQSNNQIGAMGGHSLNSKKKLLNGESISTSNIKSADDLHDALLNYDYWYSNKDGEERTLKDSYSSEFFAESFALRVYDHDLGPTRQVFTGGNKLFDEAYDKIYAQVMADPNR